jgi:drug/metabolite transporter (DMT)-like permease
VGILAGVASAIAQGAANVLMKTAVVAGSATHVASLRIGFGAVVLVVVVALTGGATTVRPFLTRGVFGPVFFASFVGTFAGMWLGTYGAKGLPIGIATTLAATTPVWALALARFTGERVTVRAVLGAVVAILGVVVLASTTAR